VTGQQDFGVIARAIIGSGLYMVLGTSDRAGMPWVSPVYYAPEGWTSFYWVSSPEATHSRNITARPSVSIVIFDSGAPISTGQGVYMSAEAIEVADAELGPAVEVFSRRTQVHGGGPWAVGDVQAPAGLRLYRADASKQWILEPGAPTDRRVEVYLGDM
jgi:Pyridoxamine 5'-phosphate oxidase